MKRNAAAVLVAAFSLAAVPALASPQSHGTPASPHQSHAPQGLTLDQGRKWETDAPLRRHMGEIRDHLARESPAIQAGKLTTDRAHALGVHLAVKAAAIVADCNLPPAADANLHIIVADLLEAADVLQGKTGLRAESGAAKAVRVTQVYATYFEHPGWKPVQ